MSRIGVLRQIVSEIKAVAPQGLRKTVRAELTAVMNKPSSLAQNEKAKDSFIRSCVYKTRYPQYSTGDYLAKVYEKEQKIVTKKTLKTINTHLDNRTGGSIEAERDFNITQGLLAAEKSGLKMPKKACLEYLNGEGGFYSTDMPGRIFIDPSEKELCRIAIHETAHLNDKVGQKLLTNSFTGFFAPFAEKLMPYLGRNTIKTQIRPRAIDNRSEFVACTADTLIYEGKNWSDLSPKIKKLYDLACGPKIKTANPQ